MGQGARRHLGEIFPRQAGQFEARGAGRDRQPSAFAGQQFGLDLGAVGKLAHDVVEHVRRRRGRTVAQHVGGQRLDNLDIQVGRGELELALARLDQDIGQDRDGVATLDHALDMVQGFQQGATLDVDLHSSTVRFADPLSGGRYGCRKRPFFQCLACVWESPAGPQDSS